MALCDRKCLADPASAVDCAGDSTLRMHSGPVEDASWFFWPSDSSLSSLSSRLTLIGLGDLLMLFFGIFSGTPQIMYLTMYIHPFGTGRGARLWRRRSINQLHRKGSYWCVTHYIVPLRFPAELPLCFELRSSGPSSSPYLTCAATVESLSLDGAGLARLVPVSTAGLGIEILCEYDRICIEEGEPRFRGGLDLTQCGEVSGPILSSALIAVVVAVDAASLQAIPKIVNVNHAPPRARGRASERRLS
ncbi:hypothetical protein D9619_000037 [Psilocybe cf. subviscida]|uniref:Uncharacterized protein n=1 Tax=Psilocybe cf. subviscida TaxID=2480587 RepID=A0A8H5BED5_9AGAR|nr:hypothetical protein D9619_000037 [Psilocybe cf. subviscida]